MPELDGNQTDKLCHIMRWNTMITPSSFLPGHWFSVVAQKSSVLLLSQGIHNLQHTNDTLRGLNFPLVVNKSHTVSQSHTKCVSHIRKHKLQSLNTTYI